MHVVPLALHGDTPALYCTTGLGKYVLGFFRGTDLTAAGCVGCSWAQQLRCSPAHSAADVELGFLTFVVQPRKSTDSLNIPPALGQEPPALSHRYSYDCMKNSKSANITGN